MLGAVVEKNADEDTETAQAPSKARASAVAKSRKVLGSIVLIVLLAVAGLSASALFSGRWMASPVLSGSMRPGFAVGGLVIGQQVPLKSLSVRDVIVFKNPDNGEQMVHRIISLEASGPGAIKVKTQGDANADPDPWTVTISQPSVYRIRWSVPLVGYLVVAFQNHRGYVLLGAGVVLLILGATTLNDRSGTKAGKRTAGQEEDPNIAGEG